MTILKNIGWYLCEGFLLVFFNFFLSFLWCKWPFWFTYNCNFATFLASWEKYFAIQHFLNLHLSHSKFKFMKKLYNFSAIQMQKADELKYEKHVNYFSRHLNDSFNNYSPIQLKRNFCLMNCYDFCWIDSHYFLPLFVYCLIINYYY